MVPQALSHGPDRQAQGLGGLGQVPGGLGHGLLQQLGFGGSGHGLEHAVQATGLGPGQAQGRGLAQTQLRKGPDGASFIEEEGPAQEHFQLPHVSRPGMVQQLPFRAALQPGRRTPLPLRGHLQQLAGQGQQILPPLPQGRYPQFQGTQALGEIWGEAPLEVQAAHPGDAATGSAVHGPSQGARRRGRQVLETRDEEAAALE